MWPLFDMGYFTNSVFTIGILAVQIWAKDISVQYRMFITPNGVVRIGPLGNLV